LPQVSTHGNIPAPPDKKLNKHHKREFALYFRKIHHVL